MHIYPEILDNIIEYLQKIPGVGVKTAERYALSLINFTQEELDDLSSNMMNLKKKLKQCEICGHLSEKNVCNICMDETRNKNLICVVENVNSIFMFEKLGTYKGTYHVLGGLISPIDGVNPADLNISKLVKRCQNSTENVEVIIALRPTIEGDTTTLYLKSVLVQFNVKVTRLSYGIPMGAEIEYLDTLTLERALNDRTNIS